MDGSLARMPLAAPSPETAIDPAEKWYVAVVMTGLERTVRQRLNELADREGCRIETFLPLVETQAFTPAKPATRKRPAIPALPQICVPMFRGYLFLQLDIGDASIPWDRVREIRGFGRLLTNEHGRPVPVRGEGFTRLMAAADKDGLIERQPKGGGLRRFQEGELVRVKMGPFMGKTGLFINHDRETVNLWLEDKRSNMLWEWIEEAA